MKDDDILTWNGKVIETHGIFKDYKLGEQVLLIVDPSDTICPCGVGDHVDIQGTSVMSFDNPKFHRTTCHGRGCAAYVERLEIDQDNVTTITMWTCGAAERGGWMVHSGQYE